MMKTIYLTVMALIILSSVCMGEILGDIKALVQNCQNLVEKPLSFSINQDSYKFQIDTKKSIAEIKPIRTNSFMPTRVIEIFDPTLLIELRNVKFALSRSF